jgi:O-antigen/teichoic acid export membrane protein
VQQYLRQLRKDAVVYGIGGALRSALGLIVLPLYTRVFDPAEYGTIELLTIVATFLGALLMTGQDSALSYYFSETKSEGTDRQRAVVSAGFQWLLLFGGVGVALAIAATPLLNAWLFQGDGSWELYSVAFAACVMGNLLAYGLTLFRLTYRPWRFFLIGMLHVVCTTAVALALILVFHMGVLGHFIGFLVGTIAAAAAAWAVNRDFLDLATPHRGWWPRLLRFGLPLVPASVAMYVLNSADRWAITAYLGRDELGVYAAGAKIALAVMLAVTAFRQAWWPIALDAMQTEHGPALHRAVARLYMGAAAAACVLAALLAPYVLRVLVPPQYQQSYAVTSILVWPAVLYGLVLIVSAGIWKGKKTEWMSVGMAISAGLNVVLNALMIPWLGLIGAAVATLIAFLVWIALVIFVSEQLWPVRYSLGRMGGQLAVGIGATGLITAMFGGWTGAAWAVWPVGAGAIAMLAALTFTGVAADDLTMANANDDEGSA